MVTDAGPLAHAWNFVRANSLLMVTGAVIALVWANVDPAGYERVTQPLHFVVNDIAMAFFFGLAMKEIIEATAPAARCIRCAGPHCQ
jgi:NhaA family Na+:H+ antiporter